MSKPDFKSLQKNVCDEIPEFLPLKRLCPRCIPNSNFLEPDWKSMVNETFLNEKTCEYQVCVTVDKDGESFILGLDGARFPEDQRERRRFLRRYIHPAIQIMLEDEGKLVADQIICAHHSSPSLASLSLEDQIALTNNIGTIFDLLKDDPQTERCLDIETIMPDEPLEIGSGVDDVINPVRATASIISKLPNINNPYALELYTYVKEFHIDPFDNLLKVLVAIPAHIFEAVPNSPTTEELEQEAIKTVEEVELDVDMLFGQIMRLKTALMVYAKYQSYFYNSQDGELKLFLNDDARGPYYAQIESKNIKKFYTTLKTVAKVNGWNIRSNVKSVVRQNARMIRIKFDASDENNPYKIKSIEAKKRGCNYEKFTRKLSMIKGSKASPTPFSSTTLNYIAKLKEIDIALQARQSYPWLEFLIKFTWPLIKVDYGKINKESVEKDAGACAAEQAVEFGLDMRDYILNQTLSIAEIFSFEWNNKTCSQLQNFDNEPEVTEFQKEFKNVGRQARQKARDEQQIEVKTSGTLGDISWSNEKELLLAINNVELVIEDYNFQIAKAVGEDLREINDQLYKLRQRKIAAETNPDPTFLIDYVENLQEYNSKKETINEEINNLTNKRDEHQRTLSVLNRILTGARRTRDQDLKEARKVAGKRAAKEARKNNHPYVKQARKLALEEFQSQDSLLTSLIDFDTWAEQGKGGLKFNSIDVDIELKTIFERMSLCNLNSLTVQGIRCLLSGLTEEAALRKIIRVALDEMDIDVIGIFISNLPQDAQSKLREEFEKEFGNLPLPWEEGYDAGSLDNTNAYKTYLKASTMFAKKRQQEERARIAAQEAQQQATEALAQATSQAAQSAEDAQSQLEQSQAEAEAQAQAEAQAEADAFQKRQDDIKTVMSFIEGVGLDGSGTYDSDLEGQQKLVSDENYDFDAWLPDGDEEAENSFRAWINKNYGSEEFAGDTVGPKLKSGWTRKNKHVEAAWNKYGELYVSAEDGLGWGMTSPTDIIPDLPDEDVAQETEEEKTTEEIINEESEKERELQSAQETEQEVEEVSEKSELSKEWESLSEEEKQAATVGAQVVQDPFRSGTYGSALGNMQELITQAYIQNMMDILEIDQLLTVLERFPGSEILPRVLNYTSCATQGMFDPPLDSFMKTFALSTCDEFGIGIGVPSLVRNPLPNFYDKHFMTKIRNEFIKKVENAWTGVLTRMLLKVLQTIDDALCKGLNAISQATAASLGLDSAIGEAFCPDGDQEDIRNTRDNLFKSAGLFPDAFPVTSGGNTISRSSFDCLFKALNATTSKREILGLLTNTPGNMDNNVLRRVASITNAYCPEFSEAFGTPDKVAEKFAIVGNKMPPELRSAFQEALNKVPDGPIFESICLTQQQKDEWDTNRINLLTENGLDEPTAQQMINNANNRALNDLGDLAKMAEKGTDGLLGDALESLLDPTRDPDCEVSKDVIQFETEELARTKKDTIRGFFESIEKNFLQDLIKGRHSVLNNILRDKNNFRLTKHELRTNYPLVWPNYADSDEAWEYRKENSNKLVTWRMENDRKRGFFPETVGIWMRTQLEEQTMTYKTAVAGSQIIMTFKDHKDDIEYEFDLKYKLLHEKDARKRLSVDQTFYRKLKKKEAKQLGLDPKELGDNKTFIPDVTNVTVKQAVNLSQYDIGYDDNSTPYQYHIFKALIEKKVGSPVATNNLSRVGDAINSTVLNFVRNAFTKSPSGDIPSGFKFGYSDQEPITFLDLHYVNPDADPNDKSTWVYTHLPNEKVLGKSATENPRVHFLDPAIHGGSYILPKIYIEPTTYNGWLGMIKTFIPEVEKCEDVDNGFLNVAEISKRVKRVEDTTPFDERLSLAPDCNVEIPFDKQFAPPTHGLMEGLVLTTTKVYVTEYILKTLAAFSSVEFSERNIDSLFTSMLIGEMKKGIMAQTTIWNVIQGYTYYLLFLEQACQTVQRQLNDGLMDLTPELEAAFAEINEVQQNFKAIKINPKEVADGVYDFSDILEIFRGSAIVGFGENGWEEEYAKILDFDLTELATETIETAAIGAAIGAAGAATAGVVALPAAAIGAGTFAALNVASDASVQTLVKLARKLKFLTPFKIELSRKISTIQRTQSAAEVVLSALIEKETKELMAKINLNLRPRPHVFDIKKYMLSRNGIVLGSTLRSGESIIEQPTVEGATGYDYGKIFDVVSDPTTENPISEYEIQVSSLSIPTGYSDMFSYLRDGVSVSNISDLDSIFQEKFLNLLPMVSEGFFYLERYLRVVGVSGNSVVYNIREFQDLVRNLNFDPDSMISDNFGNAQIVAGRLAGSIGIKFGVRLIYCPPEDFTFATPENHITEKTFKLAPVKLKIKFSEKMYEALEVLPDVIKDRFTSLLDEMEIPVKNAEHVVPIASFEQDVLDKKMSEIDLEDENFGEDLKCYIDNLVKTEDFKTIFEYCFSPQTYCSLFAAYSFYGFFESIGKDEENEEESDEDPAKLREKWKYRVFDDTKRVLRKTFNSIYRTDDDEPEERAGRDKERNARYLSNLMPEAFLNLDPSVKWWQSLRITEIKPFDADGEECLNAFQKMFK